MSYKRNYVRGNALVMGLIISSMVALSALTLISISTSSKAEVTREELRLQAYYNAETALSRALLELNNNVSYDNFGPGIVSSTNNNNEYYTSFYLDVNNTPTILATGVVNPGSEDEIKRSIEVKLSSVPGVNIPGYEKEVAALSVSGKLKKAKFSFGKAFFLDKLLDHDPDDPAESDDYFDNYTSDIASDLPSYNDEHFVHISGFDISPDGIDVPGIAIDDPDVYKRVLHQVARQIERGTLPADIVDGDPTVAYTTKSGNTINTSIVNLPNPVFSTEYYDTLIEGLSEGITGLIPDASTVVRGNNLTISQDLVLSDDPSSITYVDAETLTIDGGATVSGTGTLIVQGDININGGSLNWDGNVVLMAKAKKKNSNPIVFTQDTVKRIMYSNNALTIDYVPGSDVTPTNGKDRKVELRNIGGNISVDGNMILLASSLDSNNKALLKTDRSNASGTKPQTYIKGSLLVMAHSGKGMSGKAEVVLKDGLMDIEGVMSVIGVRSSIEMAPKRGHTHDNQKACCKKHVLNQEHPTLYVEGSVALAVPTQGNEDGLYAKLALHGEVSLKYDHVKVQEATQKLLAFNDLMQPNPPFVSQYTIVSWREVANSATKP